MNDGPPFPPPGTLADPSLAGAILALAYAVDETQARYWLATCARRGAEQPLLDQLWATWQREHTPQVIYTHTDPEDTDQ